MKNYKKIKKINLKYKKLLKFTKYVKKFDKIFVI